MAQTDKQFAQLLEIIANSKLFSELEEQTLISDDSFFASINTGLDDAKKIKLPLLRGYNGDWNASTNTPTLVNGTGVAGTIYRVSTQGTRDLGNGSLTYGVDEIIYYNGAKWVKLIQSQISDIVGLQTALDDLGVLIQLNTDNFDNYAKNIAYNSIGTGLHDGGVLSINASTTSYDIAAGSGIIVDNITDPDNPIVTHITWLDKINIVPVNIATQIATHVSIDINGDIVESTIPPSATSRRSNIYLGIIRHSNNINVGSVDQLPIVAIDVSAQVQDILNYIGFKSLSGNIITYASTDLSITKSAGSGFKGGSNFQILKSQPNEFLMVELPTVTFRYRNQDGDEDADVSLIDPTTWDNNGVTTTVSSTSKATIQRVFLFPNNIIRIQRGQKEFSNFSTALAEAGTEGFVTELNISENGLFIGSIVLQKNVLDLSDELKAVFISPLGEIGLSSLKSTLQSAYDVSAIPQIITTDDLGQVVFQRGTAADTDKVISIRNGAGSSVFDITGEGSATLSSTVASSTVPTLNAHLTNKLYVDNLDAQNVKLTGAQSIAGVKTFTDNVRISGNLATLEFYDDSELALASMKLDPYADWFEFDKAIYSAQDIRAIGSIRGSSISASTSYTFATLPVGSIGLIAHITDASTISYRAVAVGGGSSFALVVFDGTNWIYH